MSHQRLSGCNGGHMSQKYRDYWPDPSEAPAIDGSRFVSGDHSTFTDVKVG